MGITATQQEGIVQLSLGSEMTIYTAAELKGSLYKDWDKAKEIEIDLSHVDELDSAGIQLLLQLKSDSKHGHKPVRFIDHSPVVLEALEMLNLLSRFAEPRVLTAENPEA